MGYIDVANIAQKLPMTESEKVYTVYKTLLPKKKMFLKYIKNQNKKNYQELSTYITEYFECSLREANQYIDILGKSSEEILWSMGVGEKESKKIIKNAKL
jgi:hypothetical protein|tara:strand:- start:440 stop:739 length:300 start_codon:yes stop_codon:yes gene_type:complete